MDTKQILLNYVKDLNPPYEWGFTSKGNPLLDLTKLELGKTYLAPLPMSNSVDSFIWWAINLKRTCGEGLDIMLNINPDTKLPEIVIRLDNPDQHISQVPNAVKVTGEETYGN